MENVNLKNETPADAKPVLADVKIIDWDKVSINEEVIRLIKERDVLEDKIRAIDEMALVRYELEALSL